ncbi:MAG: formylglycine-generating enzyme family protein [Magnetococcales bacterium]|nr:formylglycine-generating enzyme family protein [Magnetococcales bacterium]
MDMHTGFDTLRYGITQGYAPDWVSCWGEDSIGPFIEFTVDGPQPDPPSETFINPEVYQVTQRLRWIPAGSFLMGSPEDEDGRGDDEGPQHEVTFKKGFWIFDTACTQALYEAVTGENPSEFKGPDRPVENVSWNDVQAFIIRLNVLLPGLILNLPSEAQWEHACRAGTTTPFSFGETITTDQVNYNGNHPYGDGPKGEYRQETVPVANLPANAWGLYEMHGNVYEWCADHWHQNYEDAPQNGDAWIDENLTKLEHGDLNYVLRGGSWNHNSKLVRSAFRNWVQPEFRRRYLGFRCARVEK